MEEVRRVRIADDAEPEAEGGVVISVILTIGRGVVGGESGQNKGGRGQVLFKLELTPK